MSRYYSMNVTVEDYDSIRSEQIKQAAEEHWPSFGDDWFAMEDWLQASGDDSLCGGETEEEFATRLARAIWTANDGPCRVQVVATYLEELPHEQYEFDRDDYEEWQAQKENTPDA